MRNHEFNTIAVADGTEIDTYIAFPETEEALPAIILFQEAYGVNGHIRSIAERLCDEGYAVAAPDLFHRTARRIEIAYTDFEAALPHFQAITKEGLSADVKAVYDWLNRQNVRKGKTGCIGFCLGGRVAYIANTVVPMAAAVSYYGGGLDQLTADAPKLHGPHLFFWGGKDKHITPDKVEKTISAVRKAGKEYTSVVISCADHAFNCDERPSYHPQAAKEAWAHTLAFFESRLK